MLVAVALVLELLAMIICIHKLYNQPIKIDLLSVITILISSSIMIMVNLFDLSSGLNTICYIILFIYCLRKFRDRVIPTAITLFLAIVLVAIIEFLYALVAIFLFSENMFIRDILGGLILILIVTYLIPKLKIEKLREIICRRHWLMYIILCFIVFTIFTVIILLKAQGGVQLSFFVFGIPSIAIILFMVIYWDKSIVEQKRIEAELSIIESMQNSYDDLVMRVKENQHGLKNHMMAVMSSHYTYKTYDQLVKAQKEYCGELQDNNRYNSLVIIENPTIGGFLYGKMQEIEKQGVHVNYRIESKIGDLAISYYHLIEILGVLFDNATEAVLSQDVQKIIFWRVAKDEEGYRFEVRNPFPKVGYEIIDSWFSKGDTTKGIGRGIGLYRVRELCKEWNCNIKCRNQYIENDNWIVMELVIKEKEDND